MVLGLLLPYLPFNIGLTINALKEFTILLELFLVVKVPNKILLRKKIFVLTFKTLLI
jgi:hypothetical protein